MRPNVHLFVAGTVLLSCCTIIVELATSTDYYKLLEVPRTATTRDVKKSFRKLALKYHPDHNKEVDAEEKFREIVKAYEILSDDDKRKQYDQYGAHAFDGTGESRHGSDPGGFNRDDFFRHFDQSFHAYSGGAGGHQHRGGFKFSFGQHQFDFDDFWKGFEGDESGPFFGHSPHGGGGGFGFGPAGFGFGGVPSMFGHMMGDGIMHGFDDMLHNGFHYVGDRFGMGDRAANFYDDRFSPFAEEHRHSRSSSSRGKNCRTETRRTGSTTITTTTCT